MISWLIKLTDEEISGNYFDTVTDCVKQKWHMIYFLWLSKLEIDIFFHDCLTGTGILFQICRKNKMKIIFSCRIKSKN